MRWLGRFLLETPGVALEDALLLLGAIVGLRDPAPRLALETLAGVAERLRVDSVARVARRQRTPA